MWGGSNNRVVQKKGTPRTKTFDQSEAAHDENPSPHKNQSYDMLRRKVRTQLKQIAVGPPDLGPFNWGGKIKKGGAERTSYYYVEKYSKKNRRHDRLGNKL